MGQVAHSAKNKYLPRSKYEVPGFADNIVATALEDFVGIYFTTNMKNLKPIFLNVVDISVILPYVFLGLNCYNRLHPRILKF
jgi:hypothetical protein